MAHYRIYVLDSGDHISEPPEEVECADDQAAIERAQSLLNGRAIEVWEGARCVARLESNESMRLESKLR